MDSKKIFMDSSLFGFDINVRERAENISGSLYNKGLRMAQGGDISGSIDALERSLEFSKKNVTARNLLGLGYFATGRLGEALSHWLISQAYQKEDNPATDYIENIRENQKGTDKMSHAIALYNTALEFMRNGSADMAIIRLKKCVELSPAFVDAYNLLALAYLSTGRKPNAEPYVRRALASDPFNPNSLAYYADITGANQGEQRQRGTGKPLLADDKRYSMTSKRNLVSDFRISEIICFIIGCVIVTTVFILMVVPDQNKKLNEQIGKLNDTIAMTRAAHELALAQKDDEYKEVDDIISGLEKEAAEQASIVDLKDRSLALYSAKGYFDEGNYEMAYTVVYETPTNGFTTEQIQQHAQIMHDASAKIEAYWYAEGKKAYDKNDFDGAMWHFNVAEKYTQSDSATADLMYYYMGRVSERSGDTDSAIFYYETVVSSYPGSGQYKDSNSRLNKLKQ